MSISRIVLLAASLVVVPTLLSAEEREIPPAFGPHINLTAADFADSTSFTLNDRIVGTYYFYWYDIGTRAHILNADGTDALTTHPPTLEDFSYRSVRWYQQQLRDMEAAGIDVVLPVFWGAPSEHSPQAVQHWSYAGLPPLVQAREALLREGRNPPRLGLFYDTSTLRHNGWGYHADLTTDYGRRWFYATVRDFFSCIPPRHWAMLDNQPIVLLYAAAFAKKWDQSVLAYTKQAFPKEFGGRVPWIAPQDSWGIEGDNTCYWGGALRFRNPGIGEIGPGYDHAAVPGRTPLVRDRQGGKFYEDSWRRFLRRPTHFVMIETWNEFHEGTDIAESREYGRQYIELTRQYADCFKQGKAPAWPPDTFYTARAVTASADRPHAKDGLQLVQPADGRAVWRMLAERRCWQTQPTRATRPRYLYFIVDDSFKWADLMDAVLEVEYFDAAPGRLSVEYDGSDTNAPVRGAYTRSARVPLTGDQQWKSATFSLPAARFLNSQNSDADFRFNAEASDFAVSRVILRQP